MSKMPEFETEEKLADWVDTHDTAPFIDEMEDAEEAFIVKRTPSETRPLNIINPDQKPSQKPEASGKG